jgi:hypothetical protein
MGDERVDLMEHDESAWVVDGVGRWQLNYITWSETERD